jgi:two-component system CheB/CheR fusion protein
MHKVSTTSAVLEHEVSELRLILERQTGILLDTPCDQLSRLISKRIESLHLGGAGDLLGRLRSCDAECEYFLEPLLDGATRFFAHPAAFDALVNLALPELTVRESSHEPSRTLRVWSAGCSTGEEAYSIAVSLCEAVNCSTGDWNIRIVGSDIRREALKFAERGLYPESSLEQIPRPLLPTYFARMGQHLLVKPWVRNLVSFTPMNLAKAGYIGRFDCIFCMDVLPHFSRTQRTALAKQLHLYLEPGGYLFLGQGDKLPAIDVKFDTRRHLDYTVYRKPMAAAAGHGR